MIDKKFLISPLNSVGSGVSTFMLNKKFFDQVNLFHENQPSKSLIEKKVNLPIVWLDQVHGSSIQRVKGSKPELIKRTDGLYTKKPNLVLALKTADCLPIILSNKDGNEISALHVGWRGLNKMIIEKALTFFECNLREISAWLAPSISAINYVVGEDVFYSFVNKDPESISSFQETRIKGQWLFDLNQEATRRLEKKGIKTLTNKLCTYQDKEFFYSYRRNKSEGRMVTLVWRET